MNARFFPRGAAPGTVACLLVASAAQAHVTVRPSADEKALEADTQAWKDLAADKHRRDRRDLWLEAVTNLRALAHSAASADVRDLALLHAAEAMEGMASISRSSKDFTQTDTLFREVADVAKGDVARKALEHAARIESQELRDASAARKTHARLDLFQADPPKVEQPAPPKAVASENELLRDATDHWTRLKADTKRRLFRDQWLSVIERLGAVGDKLAPAEEGGVAYARAAKAAEELSLISRRHDDIEQAALLYARVAEKYPKSALADDALVAAAGIELNRLGDEKRAREHLLAVRAGKSDAATASARLLAMLPAESPKKADAPAPVEPSRKTAVAVKPSDDEEDAPEPTEAHAPATVPAHEERAEITKAETTKAVPDDTPDELGQLVANIDAPKPSPVIASQPAPATKPSASQVKKLRTEALADTTFSLSEQVGLKVRRIIVDAGHGGHDTGAIGPTGVKEKDVTLAIAHEVAKDLRERGYEVILTRDTDDFIALEERTAIANKQRGDLFVSIHANANPSRKLTGVETYSLNLASNRYAMRLAARENATSQGSVSDLQFLLADLATRANSVDSDRLAATVQSAVVDGVGKKFGRPLDHGVKHALFYVLLGTRMPAILVETQFISNPREEKHLTSAPYQAQIAKSIATGVDQFVSRRQQLASIER